MAAGPLERIRRELGGIDPVEALAGLTPTDLQSVLLEVQRRQAARVSPAELLTRYAENRFARPSPINPSELAALEGLAWSMLPDGYQALELSPLSPLGSASVVATVDQNKVVSTIRNVEVVADSTNVLALEAALRRRRLLPERTRRFEPVGLAACQRQVRAQAFSEARSRAHFQLLGVVEAGRDRGSFLFEAAALCRQITYFVSVLGGLRPSVRIEVALTDLSGQGGILDEAVLGPLTDSLPGISIRMDPERLPGRGYYLGACYKLSVDDGSGQLMEVGDGGCTDWTSRLLSDRKERLVIGGLGVERLLV